MNASLQNSAQISYERGVEAQREGRLDAAVEAWRRALAADPAHEAARYNLAVALVLGAAEEEASWHYETLLAQNPAHRDALFNLGNLRHRQGKTREAEDLFRRILLAHPRDAAAQINLAKLLSDRKDSAAAEALLRDVLAADPQNVLAHWNLAHALIASQRWAEGWREYEWRLFLPHWIKPPVKVPAWQKDSAARRILLWNDQGIGDAIQFLRYVRFVASPEREVFVLVQDHLKSLAATVPGVAAAFGASDALPAFDAQAPLASLPHRLGLVDPARSGGFPYVRAEKSFALPVRAGVRSVGLVWAGNPAYAKDAQRSMSLRELAPLLDAPGTAFFSLQVGDAAHDIVACGLSERLADLSPRLNDFAATAAAMKSLDLVISVDTAAAHLAGALGVPCFLMLPARPDPRWPTSGDANAWYPSLRLFRQARAGDWRDVVLSVRDALR